MIVIPSLDVHNGTCLPEGGTAPSAHGANDPDEVLRALLRFGFSRFHLTDLSSRVGRREALNLTAAIMSEHSAQFQVSTDVRRRDQVDDLLAAGARFVVVGSKGIDHLDWLAEIVADDSGTVIVAVDVSTRRVHVPTAQPGMPRDAADWIHDLSHLALGAVLIRSVDGHGQSAPCDFPLLEELVEDFAFPILAAGVLQTVGELDALQDRGVAGALLGECLHTGRIDPWIAAQEFRS